MISVYPTSKPITPSISRIKSDQCVGEMDRSLLRKMSGYALVVPRTARIVEISCLNKTFRGVAFHNQGGGIDFFNEEFKDCLSVKVMEYLDYYLKTEKQLKEAISEYEAVRKDIKPRIEKFQLTLQEGQNTAETLQNEMEDLKDQIRRGDLDFNEGTVRRQRITCKMTQLKEQMSATSRDLERLEMMQSDYPSKKMRLSHLQDKIRELKQEISAPMTTTINKPGITEFCVRSGFRSHECNIFASFIDYLAYKVLRDNDDLCEKYELLHCDCIVLNSPVNLNDFILSTDQYNKVHCFFPSTVSGITLEKTLLDRNSHAVSHRDIYAGMNSLNDFVTSITRKTDN